MYSILAIDTCPVVSPSAPTLQAIPGTGVCSMEIQSAPSTGLTGLVDTMRSEGF